MKKKALAVLLAVCMIVSTCVLFASAATSYKSGDILVGSTENALKKGTEGENFKISVSVTAKSGASLPLGTKTLSASQIDDVFKFTKTGTSTTYKYENQLSNYVKITAEADESTKTVIIKDAVAIENAKLFKYVVETPFDGDDTLASTNENLKPDEEEAKVPMYEVKLATAEKAENVKFVDKLQTFTTGVRFFGKPYDNLVASEIAKVKIFVYRTSTGKTTSSVANSVSDLRVGDVVEIVTYLKNKDDQSFYAFNCWTSGDEVVSSGTKTTLDKLVESGDAAYNCFNAEGNLDRVAYTYKYTVDSSKTVYANYVEIVNRHTIDYKSTGNGKVVYEEGREVFNGDAQISVMDGKAATFTFVPDEGYEVAKVVVDGDNVTSFLRLTKFKGEGLLAAIKELIAATDKDNYSYTFPAKKNDKDHSIVVTFQKVTPIEAPEGGELPTVSAEGITLGTSADEANGEGGAKGDATTVPAENGAAANGGSAASGVVNPATGSASAIAVFATLAVAAGAAFVTAKKKED